MGLEGIWDEGIWDVWENWEFVDLDEFWDTLEIDLDGVLGLGLCWSICIRDE